MGKLMAVLLNGEAVIEYDRSKSLAEKQREYLDRLDQQMSQGITLDNEQLISPDEQQKARFMALQLVQALVADDEARIAASCAYLAERLPELKQVKAEHNAEHGSFFIDLVFDNEYQNQVKVSFQS